MLNYFETNFTQDTLDDLINLNSEESINLEFKRGDALNKADKNKIELSKDVSAMANADGGVIIYGIVEKNHKADSYSFVDGNVITKEWLENVLNSRIHRRIEGLIIEAIRYNNDFNKSIYVVKIPRSKNAPHMTSEKKFYKRFNFQAVQMEEYEIRALYSRPENTLLKLVFNGVGQRAGTFIGGKFDQYFVSLVFSATNIGSTIESLYKLQLMIPGSLVDYSDRMQPLLLKYNKRETGLYTVISVPAESPLFQDETISFPKLTLTVVKQNFEALSSIPIIVKLFYSNGTDDITFLLGDYVKYIDNKLTIDHFRQ
jgi:hypothetical protein